MKTVSLTVSYQALKVIKRVYNMKTRKLTFAALCLSAALLLPQLFHLLGLQQAGQVFLPMHIPVLLSGLLLGWQYGALLGFIAPLLSFLLTGMPSGDRVLFMMAELFAYGFTAGLCYQRLLNKHTLTHAYLALLTAMIAGRVCYGLALSAATLLFHIPLGGFWVVWTAVITGIPGIITQLLFLPALVRVMEKGGYMREAYAVEINSK